MLAQQCWVYFSACLVLWSSDHALHTVTQYLLTQWRKSVAILHRLLRAVSMTHQVSFRCLNFYLYDQNDQDHSHNSKYSVGSSCTLFRMLS